jgi:hypothetical protein
MSSSQEKSQRFKTKGYWPVWIILWIFYGIVDCIFYVLSHEYENEMSRILCPVYRKITFLDHLFPDITIFTIQSGCSHIPTFPSLYLLLLYVKAACSIVFVPFSIALDLFTSISAKEKRFAYSELQKGLYVSSFLKTWFILYSVSTVLFLTFWLGNIYFNGAGDDFDLVQRITIEDCFLMFLYIMGIAPFATIKYTLIWPAEYHFSRKSKEEII